MIHILVRSGSLAGRQFSFDQDVVRVGRAPANDLVVPDAHVSAHHLRLICGPHRNVIEDLRSTRGTTVSTGESKRRLDEASGLAAAIGSTCVLEMGSAEQSTVLDVRLDDGDDARVVSMRRIEDIGPAAAGYERDPDMLQRLYSALKKVGAAEDLDEVLRSICDGVLWIVPRATHVTITLRDDDAAVEEPVYVPVMTRVRGPDGAGRAPDGPIPIARSVYRKVVRERAAVLAADAPTDVAQVESIVGASIRSTVAVPLWRGEHILGVIQADNRRAPSMLNAGDLEVLALFASNASLAVSNARLIRRLQVVQEQLRKENTFLRNRDSRDRPQEVIGSSAAMLALQDKLNKVVDTRVTVLVEGETGVGKELIASAVHFRSRRRDKLFVAQNCAAMPENLLESELFGHKRGSFTGATEDKKGLFDIADGGTLFLDEVGEVSPSLQSKLLRVLQDGEIRPVGAAHPHHVDVRIVAATNRNLEREVQSGRFREDLYYRLKVFPLRVPPLRERREDIPLMAGAFLKRYAREIGKAVGGFSQQAMELLVAYDWPGNVRELQNEVQRLVIQLDDGMFVVPEMLSERIRAVEGIVAKTGVVKGTLREMVDQIEKYLLIEALREHGNNKTNAAKTLGITREGLHKKLRGHGL